MNDVSTYTQVTTIAICILVATQVVFLIIMSVIGVKIARILRNIHETTEMSKAFVSELREKQAKNASLVGLGWHLYKKLKNRR